MDNSPLGSSVSGIFQTRYWSELPFPSPGDLPDPGSNSRFLLSPALADGFFTTVPPYEVLQLNKWLWQIKLFLKGITFSDFSFHFLKIFFSISLLFFFFFSPARPHGLWNLSSPSRDWPGVLAVKAQRPNHWAIRKHLLFLLSLGY